MAEGKTILTILTFCTNYDFCRVGKKPKINCEMVPFSKKNYNNQIFWFEFPRNALFFLIRTRTSLFGVKQEIFCHKEKKFLQICKKASPTHQISSNVRGLNLTIKKIGST